MEDTDPKSLSENDVYALLADQRRRLLVQFLRDSAAPVPTNDLSRHIGRHEYDDPSDDLFDLISVSLSHIHLPKLTRVDVIRYEATGEAVTPGPNFDILADALERDDEPVGP